MVKKNVLIVSQVIPQWYVDILTDALGENTDIDIITGSDITGNVIPSPKHDAESLKSRLVCWYKHMYFMNKWMRENKSKHYDLIFAVSNPPINSYIGLKLKNKFHATLIYMNWDLYPQVIYSSIHNPLVKFICKLWSNWNCKNYPKIDRMLTIGGVMAESLIKDLKKPIPVEVLPVAVNTEYLKPIEKKNNPFSLQYGLNDKFIVLYSGKMGMGHNIEVILEAANKLENNEDIRFVFIGSGPKYSVVESFIKNNNSKNVLLFPMQPDDVFPYSMACGDVGIVTQEASMAPLFMPSKVYSMMACGMAIIGICTEHDDLNQLLKDNSIGLSIIDQSAESIVDALSSLVNDNEMLNKYKSSSRNVAEMKYSSEVIANLYRKMFESCISED